MRLHRPKVPLAVEIAVIERQLGIESQSAAESMTGRQRRLYLARLLGRKFGGQAAHLDHDPPLMLRSFDPETRKYTPDANDPGFLIWRTAEEHRIKTYIRGDGAQLSDAGKRRKELRRLRKAGRPRRKWPSRKLRWKRREP